MAQLARSMSNNPVEISLEQGFHLLWGYNAETEKMNETKRGLASYGLDNAIRLRWALRDISAKRLRWCPVSPEDLRTLIDMRLVEMKDGEPVITLAGMDEKEVGD